MPKYMVRLKKNHTLSELAKGAVGLGAEKSIIVECDRADVEKTVKKGKGWKIKSIEDWTALQ